MNEIDWGWLQGLNVRGWSFVLLIWTVLEAFFQLLFLTLVLWTATDLWQPKVRFVKKKTFQINPIYDTWSGQKKGGDFAHWTLNMKKINNKDF